MLTICSFFALPSPVHPQNLATYNATKSAVDALVRGSTPIYAKHGARIFSVNPMIYETEMTGGE